MRIVLIVFLFVSINSKLMAIDIDASLGWADYQRYGFAVNGVVEEKVVSVGSKVKVGDVLAKLDAQPFNYLLQQYQSSVNQFSPAIVDAKLELDHAQELYERTVLSEVELQKIDGVHKAVISRQNIEKAKLRLARWNLKRSVLKSGSDAYVLSSNVLPGMIISDENKSTVFIELVSATKASAIAWLSVKQKSQLIAGDIVKVIVDGQSIPANIESIAMQASDTGKYKILVDFYYNQKVEPGKSVKVSL